MGGGNMAQSNVLLTFDGEKRFVVNDIEPTDDGFTCWVVNGAWAMEVRGNGIYALDMPGKVEPELVGSFAVMEQSPVTGDTPQGTA
jgi:hypothetical protein